MWLPELPPGSLWLFTTYSCFWLNSLPVYYCVNINYVLERKIFLIHLISFLGYHGYTIFFSFINCWSEFQGKDKILLLRISHNEVCNTTFKNLGSEYSTLAKIRKRSSLWKDRGERNPLSEWAIRQNGPHLVSITMFSFASVQRLDISPSGKAQTTQQCTEKLLLPA